MQTVFISALTAGAVTLLIEYVAKPRLEVRKDRVLEAHRLRREFMTRLLQFIQHIPNEGMAAVNPYSQRIDRTKIDAFIADFKSLRYDYPEFAQAIANWKRQIIVQYFAELGSLKDKLEDFLEAYGEEDLDSTDNQPSVVKLCDAVFGRAHILGAMIHLVLHASPFHLKEYYEAKKIWHRGKKWKAPLEFSTPDESRSGDAPGSS